MRRVARRVVTVLVAVGLLVSAGSAVLTSSASAGGISNTTGIMNALVRNLTPYTMTLVAAETPGTTPLYPNGGDFWYARPPDTIAPGGDGGWVLRPNDNYNRGPGGYVYGYDAYMTYRVDVLGGPAEFVTVAISQAESTGSYGTAHPAIDVYNTTAPPPAGWDPGFRNAPAAASANAQVDYEHNTPGLFDQELSLTGGNYTFDATAAQDAPFAELLNAACGGATDAACSFTQSTLTYGPGPLTLATPQFNTCVGPGGGPDNDNNYASVEYDASQTATLSVGGGLSVGAESSIFGAVTVGSTMSIEASKQWGDTATYSRTSKVYLPANTAGLSGSRRWSARSRERSSPRSDRRPSPPRTSPRCAAACPRLPIPSTIPWRRSA